MVLVLCLTLLTGFASVKQTVPRAEAPESSLPMTPAEGEQAMGAGLLSCGAAIGGALLISSTLFGSVVGAVLIACGCDDELDSLFGTNFKQACS